MNPPAALYGAMNRERKPFTYTPGGLDLSEIKSERMAKRLMRNAMNQGVPDTPVQPIRSPPSSSIPVAIPNYNCLPVQVFPTFTLPANPKSLLRTRSNPDGSSQSIYKPPSTSHCIDSTGSSLNTSKPSLIPTVKNNSNVNNVPLTLNNYNNTTNNVYSLPKIKNCDNDKILLSPLINYDAEYLSSPPVRETKANRLTSEGINNYALPSIMLLHNEPSSILTIQDSNNVMTKPTLRKSNNNNTYTNDYNLLEIDCENDSDKRISPKINNFPTSLEKNVEVSPADHTKNGSLLETSNPTTPEVIFNNNILMLSNNNISSKNKYNLETIKDDNNDNKPFLPEISYEAEYFSTIANIETDNKRNAPERTNSTAPSLERLQNENLDMFIKTTTNSDCNHVISKSLENKNTNEKKETTTIKKPLKQENEVEAQNGETDAAVTVKLPSKKSAAKTETQVEVVKKVLPDGSVEEIKTTTTKTTIDGKTEIKITTETTTIPKEETSEVEEEEEEEEDVEKEEEEVVKEEEITNEEKKVNEVDDSKLKNNKETEPTQKTKGCIITQEEKSETSTTKKVTVVQSESQESEEEVEEEVNEAVEVEDDDEPDVEEVVVIKKQETEKSENIEERVTQPEKLTNTETIKDESENSENESVHEENDENEMKGNKIFDKENPKEDFKQEEEEEEIEESEEAIEQQLEEKESDNKGSELLNSTQEINEKSQQEQDTIEKEAEEEEFKEAEDKGLESEEQLLSQTQQVEISSNCNIQNKVEEAIIEEKIIPIQQESTDKGGNVTETENQNTKCSSLIRDHLREPSVPLEKVEDVEIKPIGPAQEIIKKSHTEIITTKTAPPGALSTQTEYNRIENIVTVNRTTKTLEHAYEQAAEHTIPIVKTYFPPPEILSQPATRPYKPIYPTGPEPERRHSLLLDRLSMERQLPSSDSRQNNYSSNNQSYEETQYSFEPQSEVLMESNVKPSAISKNQQWYQQTKKETSAPSQDWSQQQMQYPPDPQYQPQSQYQTQPQYQSQPQYQPQQQFQPQPQVQTQYILPQQQLQSSYTENSVKNSYKSVTDDYKQNTYAAYTPKPSWVSSTLESKHPLPPQSNQYSLKNQSRETYQNSSQQLNSSYVLPPWEQDTGYTSENLNQNVYQPQPTPNTFTPTQSQSWKPNPPATKFTKPTPTAYIPPAPNQSFVKPVSSTEPPVLPGRKTYYSEYERRYISVPESTYIPTETKYQAQPNPSPTYYYDQVETTETVEPQWRKELREFTEKTQTTQIQETSVRPPWEEDSKYVAPEITPTWSQTLRPQSWQERSYETEYTSAKEWPKTNTLGRGRPQSSYVKNGMDRIPERPRGVSVDRYNPNSYQMPEHPPVQSQTLDHSIHPKPHYNPNVPGYHSRASAEPRELPVHSRSWGESRASPLQSRSFKYLQWITGTED